MSDPPNPLHQHAHHGMPARLYAALPALLRRLDEPTPDDLGQGTLRALLDVLGATLNQVREGARQLEDRHDLDRMPANRLPDVAAWIGWTLDPRAGPSEWRDELRRVPEIYRDLGSAKRLGAVVIRETGLEVRWKRMADRVLLTNAPERTWANDRSAWSTTLNTQDHGRLRSLGTFEDSAHYTFERHRFDAATVEGWIALRDERPSAHRSLGARLDRLLEPLKPLHVTLRWVFVLPTSEERLPVAERLVDRTSSPTER